MYVCVDSCLSLSVCRAINSIKRTDLLLSCVLSLAVLPSVSYW
jgi:hypothetical protein